MIHRAKNYDEVRVTIGGELNYWVFVDYDEDGFFVTWPVTAEVNKWRILIVLLKIVGSLFAPGWRVKVLTLEAVAAGHVEKYEGSAPIKEEPPF